MIGAQQGVLTHLGNRAKNEANDGTTYCDMSIKKQGSGAVRTNVQDPSDAHRRNDTSVVETLYPQTKSQTSPRANTVTCGLPEEDGDSATGNASD